jgi:hypothetical protein
MAAVDTANVTNRRKLHFADFAQMEADAQSLAGAESARQLKKLGNWTLGQALNHLATWTTYPFEGYPMKVPLPIRLMLRPMKNRFLKGPMPSGRHIPNVKGGTFAIDPISTQEALKKLKAADARLQAKMPTAPNPVFGKLTHQEWIALQLRHAELHLSFFRIE